ncbi:dienelactone hydrolase family protein [Amycolatopsis sp. QT-25]|uniref:dienelactone hydrolase family protein n=1 Tax=Amycolatopsis sp. QT-25 TaxID=3034022 RepID=UPI0023ED60EF|nr:dienelactone hydrolase family protein [Amycolatopsis sp. QT-25]WET81605.1 dienelactone hydrolase family protein [Amycolatopsis sp. QT-25]
MCHDVGSRPPAPPRRQAARPAESLRLTSADGSTFAAFEAAPVAASTASVVLLPDVRGAHPFYRDLTERFAEAGLATAAIDYYGRTATSDDRDGDFPWQELLPQVRPDDVTADVQAAAYHLRARHDGPVFTVGFCFGGGQSWRLAASDIGLAGVVGFYGLPAPAREIAAQARIPVLMLLAGEDVATPQAEFDALAAELAADTQMHVYPGAPHSFFDRSHAEWADACTDAWNRVLAFTAGNPS